MILQSSSGRQGLSVVERLSAVNDGFRRNDDLGADFLWRSVGLAAAVALVIALAVWATRQLRRLRWIGHHVRALAAGGLHDEEIALFRALARRCELDRLPRLTRQSGTFDFRAAEMVRRHQPASGRQELLARLLALRRRMPFEGRAGRVAEFPPGLALLVCVRVAGGEPFRLPAKVAAVVVEKPEELQLELENTAPAREVAPLLRAGAEVILVVQRDLVFQEARVRIRGVVPGAATGLVVDRPVELAPARVRIVWQETDERVPVELMERFSKRFVGDEVPMVEGRVLAASSEGVVVQLTTTRPRHGESIRITEGARAGVYRGYAALDRKGMGGVVFLLRRSGARMNSDERTSALRRPAEAAAPAKTANQKGNRNEPARRS